MSRTCKLLLILLALSSLAFAQPDWVLNITLQKGTTSIPLAIGGATTATDAFDVDFDVLSPPPPPSTTDYFAYLEIVDPLFTMLTRDVRGWVSPYSTPIEWKIKIMNSGGAQTTFSWNTAEVPAQDYFYLGGVNMRTASSTIFSGDGTVYLRFGQMVSRPFALNAGWNMVSINLQPQNTLLTTMLSELAGNLIIMKSGTGLVYWPALGIDQIVNWNALKGYQMYMQSSATLNVLGTPIAPESTPIALVQGWNLVAYLRDTPMSIVTDVVGIVSNLTIAKNGGGQVYWPALGINTIINMLPGQGYQLHMLTASTLTYPANTVLARDGYAQPQAQKQPAFFRGAAANTGANAILLVKGERLRDGDEIGVWAGAKLVGSGVVQGQRALVIAWGDDQMTAEKDGALEGEPLSFTVWSQKEGRQHELQADRVIYGLSGLENRGNVTFQADEVWIIEAAVDEKLPDGFVLAQNYPNPFNPVTTISFQLPMEGRVELAVYNLSGEKIRTLFFGRKGAGVHQIVWNALKDDGQPASSGVYWLQLRSDGFEKRIKMTLVK